MEATVRRGHVGLYDLHRGTLGVDQRRPRGRQVDPGVRVEGVFPGDRLARHAPGENVVLEQRLQDRRRDAVDVVRADAGGQEGGVCRGKNLQRFQIVRVAATAAAAGYIFSGRRGMQTVVFAGGG